MDLFSHSRGRAGKPDATPSVSSGDKDVSGGGKGKVIRRGSAVTLYTVGYEKRDGDELMTLLRDHGVRALADVREKPMSRKPDFRAGALRRFCEEAGIEYQSWSCLGSTAQQRDRLQDTGDFDFFVRTFRAHAERTMRIDLERLGRSIRAKPTVLLCYERDHFDCHRSIIADLVGEAVDATVLAL